MSTRADQLLSIDRNEALRSGFRLGVVTIDPGFGSATGPGGRYQLDPRVMDVLVCLARAEGELVTRETLMQEVWGDVIVTDFALSRCIYQLRKQLALAARDDQPPIETLPKRGYRLVWPVDIAGSDVKEDGAVGSRIRLLGASLLGLALVVMAAVGFYRTHQSESPQVPPPAGPSQVRLAVFPLEDQSDKQDQGVFARGVSQELIHNLGRIPGLTVMGRSSAFDTHPDDPPDMDSAAQLGVDYLLAGSIRTIGDNRRILFHLQTVPAGEQVWSHSVLLEPDAPFLAIRYATAEVAELFQFSVNPGNAKASTDNLKAFELSLAASNATQIDAQRQLLKRAVELDPDFADAWIALASIEVIHVWNGEETVENAWARCEPYLQRAMEIDPASPSLYVELGRFKREFGDMDAAIELFRKALKLDPGDVWASANLGLVLRFTGRFEEALAVHEHDVALDPLNALAQTRLGTSNWFVENFDEAEKHYRLAMELDPFDEELYDSWSGMLGFGLGEVDDALRMMQRKMKLESQPSPRSLSFAASLSSLLGLDEMAETYWRQADEAAPKPASLAGQQALYYLTRNEDEKAQSAARNALANDAQDFDAQLVLAILDTERGRTQELAERLDGTYSDLLEAGAQVGLTTVEPALLLAYGRLATMQAESSARVLKNIVHQLSPARSREHFWLAAAYAMLGDTGTAMRELQASPPGRVRLHAALLMRDPRFAALHELPEFQQLVQGHLAELERQRVSYLANPATAEGHLAVWMNDGPG
jgi:DNA-binding winged helix-turn-helix (wHTH) protein/TolB-like protein/Tfp pilus assembly protein PilF